MRRRVHLGSFGSFGRAPGYFGFVLFIRVRPRRSHVDSGSFGSLSRARWFVGFIHVCLVHPGGHRGSFGHALQGSSVLFAVFWLILGESRGSSGSFWFVCFIRERPGGRWVHSDPFGSF